MTTVNSNRQILDLKRWEVCPNPISITTGGTFVMCDSIYQYGITTSSTTSQLYNAHEDSTYLLGSSGSTVTPTAGTCGFGHPWSTGTTAGVASLTATSGTTSTLTTNQPLARDLRGWKIQIMEGPNAGSTLDILKNTVGANAVVTVSTQASAFDNTTKYRFLTPRFYFQFASSGSTDMRAYDFATNTWVDLTNNSSVFGFTSDGAMTGTPSWIGQGYNSFATGTATSATSTTLVNSGKSWATNQWVNYQIRITGGTGAGQIRTITANTSTSVTVSTWTTTPDSTSTYSIEGNDDFLYVIGNGSTAMYRYSISSNSWTSISPAVARGGIADRGICLFWISESLDSDWTNESSIINGRRMYSVRGGTSPNMDYYDIPSNSWVSVTYNTASNLWWETGSRHVLIKDKMYSLTSSGMSQWVYFDCVKSCIEPWTRQPAIGSVANYIAQTAFRTYYKDGNTVINFINYVPQFSSISDYVLRMMVI